MKVFCEDCGEEIMVGQPIVYVKHDGAYHGHVPCTMYHGHVPRNLKEPTVTVDPVDRARWKLDEETEMEKGIRGMA